MDINQGVCHQVLSEKGFAYPGQLIVITDSHTTTHGALGAFSTGVGATDLAIVMKTGKLWFRVPPIIKIELIGTLRSGVYAKDVILNILSRLGADYAVYKGVEFAGPVVENMEIPERKVLCNMATEMGAKCTYIKPDEKTKKYLKDINIEDYRVVSTDKDYKYLEELIYDVTDLEPQVALPSRVDQVVSLKEVTNKHINQAYIGSCTGGQLQDLAVAAKILQGKKINKKVRLIISPASSLVLLKAIELGYVSSLIRAGATFVTPGCGACLGVHQGILGKDEICITSTNRNFSGRMGHVDAKLYLASSATVASAALYGKITDTGLRNQ